MKERAQTAALTTLIVLGMLLGVYLVYRLAPIIILVIIAIVFTNGIDPLVDRLQRLGTRGRFLPRPVATIIVLLVGAVVVSLLFTILTVTAIKQSIDFSQHTWPELSKRTIAWANKIADDYPYFPKPAVALEWIRSQSGQIAGYVWSTTRTVFGLLGGLFSLFLVLIMTFFFSSFKDQIVYTFLQFIPPAWQPRAQDISHKAALKMGGWLRGQLTLALLIATLTSIGMFALGVPYAMMIGILGGIGEMIPMVGPILAFFPAIAIVLVIQAPWWVVICVVAFFIILTQCENYLFAPYIMQKNVELPPITTILAVLTGGSLLGIVGALLAIPLTAAGRVIMLEAVFPAIQGKSREEIESGRPAETTPEGDALVAMQQAKSAKRRKKAASPPKVKDTAR